MHPSYEQVIFTWGKFSGQTLGHVYRTNPSYLQWITDTPGLPAVWKEAAKRALKGGDVSDLSLPKTKTSSYKEPQKEDSSQRNILVDLKDKNTAFIDMPYNKLWLEQFKFEIDGRKWNGENKHWTFPAVHLPKVKKLFSGAVFSEKAQKLMGKLTERREELDEIRELEDTDFKVPGLKLNLYPYQRVGVRFVDRAGGRCLIADAPGLGKTVQAISYAQLHNLKTLIVCPLSVVVNWQREIKKFTGKNSTIWTTKTREGGKNDQFHIVHYDAVGKVAKNLTDEKFDLLVCDEATYLKNRQTIRAKSVLGSYKERRRFPGIKTKYVIFLTGTPVMSRPIEAFALLNFLDKDRFNNFYHFTQRYGGWKGDAPRNLTDLHDRTKDLVIRRMKNQVLKELPDKQRNDLYVELTPAEKKEYNKLLKEMFGMWRESGKPSVQHMPKLQSFLTEKKMPRLIEMVDEFLDNDRPILIFSCYIAPLKFLHEHYGDKSAILTGAMKKEERQVSIDRLTNGEAKVGLFSLKAAGMGIDGLQHKIDTVVFIDMDWVPANHEQAEDRTHRIGQTSQVQAYYMICDGTIDEYMRDILKEKQEIADMIVDGALVTPERQKSVFKEFVKRLGSGEGQFFDVENIDE
jgi:SWI/SNF-related matrix-associated actin-dependent regulator of chromatin subfamily A-like protein 1